MSAAGRPSKTDPETIRRGLDVVMLRGFGVPLQAIAERFGCSLSWAYDLEKIGRAQPQPETADAPPPGPNGAPQAAAAPAAEPAPRKQTRARLLERIYIATQTVDVDRMMPDALLQRTWTRALVNIRDHAEDGIRLSFGDWGDRYASRQQFADWCGCEFSDLQRLLELRVIEALPDGGIAIPNCYDLLPKPKRPRGTARRPVPGQRNLPGLLHLVPPSVVADSGPAGIFPESDSGKIPGNPPISPETDSGNIANFPESDSGRASRAAAAAAQESRDSSLSSSSSSSAGARDDSGEIPGRPESDSGEIPGQPESDSGNIPGISPESDSGNIAPDPPSPGEALAVELVALAGLGRAAKPREIGLVRGWLEAGLPPAIIREVAATKLARALTPPTSLAYLEPAMREEAGRLMAAPPAAKPPPAADPPAPAEPEDDPALAEGPSPQAQWERARKLVRKAIGYPEFRAWLKDARLVEIAGDEATVSLPSRYLRDHAAATHSDRILAALRHENPAIRRLELTVASQRLPAD